MFERAKMVPQVLKLQKALKSVEETAKAGDGAVEITAGVAIDRQSFGVEVKSLSINREKVSDDEELERHLKSAFNQVSKKVMTEVTALMQEMAGGLNLSGM